MLESGRLRLAADVYSYGILLWELVHLGAPRAQPNSRHNSHTNGTSSSSSLSATIKGVYDDVGSTMAQQWVIAQRVVDTGMRPVFTAPAVPGPYVKLAQRCWSTDPAQRPTFSEIVQLLEAVVLGGPSVGKGSNSIDSF